mmetsp:Transcript_98210/g.306323  ORF Transcript_98210/g.306323 Transcript_98210/m.306323 type:complete len:205 (-) Transcript_98210:78-692(-)
MACTCHSCSLAMLPVEISTTAVLEDRSHALRAACSAPRLCLSWAIGADTGPVVLMFAGSGTGGSRPKKEFTSTTPRFVCLCSILPKSPAEFAILPMAPSCVTEPGRLMTRSILNSSAASCAASAQKSATITLGFGSADLMTPLTGSLHSARRPENGELPVSRSRCSNVSAVMPPQAIGRKVPPMLCTLGFHFGSSKSLVQTNTP